MKAENIKIIACEVMKDEIESVLPAGGVEIEYVEMGFHLYPEKLRGELQRIIDASAGYDRIILAFGLCGGAATGLRSNGSILTIPKVHDCVSIFLCRGNRPVYTFEKEMGVFYLTTGWMISERNIIAEHKRLTEKYGTKRAENLFRRMYDSYQKVLFIKTGCPLEQRALAESQQIAALFRVEHEVTENKSAFFQKIVAGPWDDDEFINIAPGESFSEDAFFVTDRGEQPSQAGELQYE